MALSIDHVTISASQLERSLAHYAALLELLGFARQSNDIWTDGGGVFFQIVAARAGTRPYDRSSPGLNHLGFGAPDAAFVEHVRDAMRARGFEAPEVQHIRGATCLFIKDPDGLRFEISHYPPGVPVVG